MVQLTLLGYVVVSLSPRFVHPHPSGSWVPDAGATPREEAVDGLQRVYFSLVTARIPWLLHHQGQCILKFCCCQKSLYSTMEKKKKYPTHWKFFPV